MAGQQCSLRLVGSAGVRSVILSRNGFITLNVVRGWGPSLQQTLWI